VIGLLLCRELCQLRPGLAALHHSRSLYAISLIFCLVLLDAWLNRDVISHWAANGRHTDSDGFAFAFGGRVHRADLASVLGCGDTETIGGFSFGWIRGLAIRFGYGAGDGAS